MIISETKLDDSYPKSRFLIEGFAETFRLDRDKNGGDILINVRDFLPCKKLNGGDILIYVRDFIPCKKLNGGDILIYVRDFIPCKKLNGGDILIYV